MSFSSSLFFPLVPYCVFLFLFHCEYIFKWRKIPGFTFLRWVAIRQNGTSDWLCVYVSDCDTEAWTRKKCCVFIVSARSTGATGYDLFFILFFTKHLFSAMMMMALCASKLTTFYPLSCWTKIKWIFAAALPLHPILLQYFFSPVSPVYCCYSSSLCNKNIHFKRPTHYERYLWENRMAMD